MQRFSLCPVFFLASGSKDTGLEADPVFLEALTRV